MSRINLSRGTVGRAPAAATGTGTARLPRVRRIDRRDQNDFLKRRRAGPLHADSGVTMAKVS